MAQQWDIIRSDVRAAIQARAGALNTTTVAGVAIEAGVAYTTLARFLHLYPDAAQKTKRLHQRTLLRVAAALQIDPETLGAGRVAEQLGLWPHIFRGDDIDQLDPYTEARRALAHVQRYSRDLQLQICRTVVAALLDAGAAAGVILPPDVYEALIKLDLGRGTRVAERRVVA
jgi:hypothetical protein